MGQLHQAMPATSAIALAAACASEGTLPAQKMIRGCSDHFLLGHCAGIIAVAASVRDGGIEQVTLFRTARTLMRGDVLIPKR